MGIIVTVLFLTILIAFIVDSVTVCAGSLFIQACRVFRINADVDDLARFTIYALLKSFRPITIAPNFNYKLHRRRPAWLFFFSVICFDGLESIVCMLLFW